MTNKPFKFRYTSEIAGTFVILSVVLLILGIVLSGRAQGWFEGTFVLKTTFDTEEGAFGLQEGNEVRIRNTLAGRVDEIRPTADGSMEATFTLKDRFKPFLTKNSVANVRKKFGVAGDSFVDIEKGKGPPIADGDRIVCKKDEEIMETAKKVLADVQSVVLPLLDETKQVLQHVNGIVGGVERGDGAVGALLNDKRLADKITMTVDNVNDLLQESQEVVAETTRLVKGAQKHWLLRKYVEADNASGYVSPRRFNDTELKRYGARFASGLDRARIANDSREISRNAYNLAVCLLGEDRYDEVTELLSESEVESSGSREDTIRIRMLESEVARRRGQGERAIETMKAAAGLFDKSVGKDMQMECRLMMAHLLCEVGRIDEAKSELTAIASLLRKTKSVRLKAMAAGIAGEVMLSEHRPDQAAVQFDLEMELLREAGAYYEMAGALESAGKAYEQAGDSATAADRYFRAARSWLASGYSEPGEKAVQEGSVPARLCGNKVLLTQLARLTNVTDRVEDLQREAVVEEGVAPPH